MKEFTGLTEVRIRCTNVRSATEGSPGGWGLDSPDSSRAAEDDMPLSGMGGKGPAGWGVGALAKTDNRSETRPAGSSDPPQEGGLDVFSNNPTQSHADNKQTGRAQHSTDSTPQERVRGTHEGPAPYREVPLKVRGTLKGEQGLLGGCFEQSAILKQKKEFPQFEDDGGNFQCVCLFPPVLCYQSWTLKTVAEGRAQAIAWKNKHTYIQG